MTLTKWRTTKIPEFYFGEIERVLTSSQRYISVSEFIRTAIEEKLVGEKHEKEFLLLKDLVFTEARILDIHEHIAAMFPMNENGVLKKDVRGVIERSMSAELLPFLSRFTKNFAWYHPFKDGNKRTLLVTIDTFLRINGKKLLLKVSTKKETKDEVFFWQNSAQQKSIPEIEQFLRQHITSQKTTYDVEEAIESSIKENKVFLEKLSR